MTIIGKRSIANGRKIRWDRQIVNLHGIKIMERIKGCKVVSLPGGWQRVAFLCLMAGNVESTPALEESNERKK